MTRLVAAPLRAVENRPTLSSSEHEHYLNRLTQLSLRVAIYTSSDILTNAHQVWLKKDEYLSSQAADTKPAPQLPFDFDKNLHIEGKITNDTLIGHFKLMIEADPALKHFGEDHDWLAIIQPFCAPLAAHPSLLTKLTCLSYCYPQAFKNALFTAWLGVISAELKNESKAQTSILFMSALFQSLGLLFLPESIALDAKSLSAEDRVALHTYPKLGYKLLCSYKNIKEDIARAVLEHREHLDGSGYPSAKLGNNISPTAQLLNVLSSLHAAYVYRLKPASRPLSALVSIIKMNGHTRFGRSGIKLIDTVNDNSAEYPSTLPIEAMPTFIGLVRSTFHYLKKCIDAAESLSISIGFRHNNSRLYALQNRIIHIDIAITQSEVINDAYLRLMEHIEKNKLTHAYGEVEDTFLRMHEVVFHIEKLNQSLAIFLEEPPVNQEHAIEVQEGLKVLNAIQPPEVPQELAATWVGTITNQRHDHL